jgi:hypothetical protein
LGGTREGSCGKAKWEMAWKGWRTSEGLEETLETERERRKASESVSRKRRPGSSSSRAERSWAGGWRRATERARDQ